MKAIPFCHILTYCKKLKGYCKVAACSAHNAHVRMSIYGAVFCGVLLDTFLAIVGDYVCVLWAFLFEFSTECQRVADLERWPDSDASLQA